MARLRFARAILTMLIRFCWIRRRRTKPSIGRSRRLWKMACARRLTGIKRTALRRPLRISNKRKRRTRRLSAWRRVQPSKAESILNNLGRINVSEFTNTKILIVGGAGFVGSNLVKKILESGPREIVIVDNL